jgi:hypothetical protein
VKFWSTTEWCSPATAGLIQYKNGQLCWCVPRGPGGYWVSLSDDPTGTNTAICNQGTDCTFENWNWSEGCQKGKCTAIPANAHICAGTDTLWKDETTILKDSCDKADSCEAVCNEGYHKEGKNCVSNYQTGSCTTLSLNNTKIVNDTFTKTRNPTTKQYEPTVSPSRQYTSVAGAVWCVFDCADGYTYEGGQCIKSKVSACTGLPPSNASWNIVPTIVQNWNGTAWTPSLTGSYNTGASSTECRFKCNANFIWNGSSCVQPSCADGGYQASIPSGQTCSSVSYAGKTCYTNCKPSRCMQQCEVFVSLVSCSDSTDKRGQWTTQISYNSWDNKWRPIVCSSNLSTTYRERDRCDQLKGDGHTPSGYWTPGSYPYSPC